MVKGNLFHLITFIFQVTKGKPIKVMCNVPTMMERTYDEFIKLLQNRDAIEIAKSNDKSTVVVSPI